MPNTAMLSLSLIGAFTVAYVAIRLPVVVAYRWTGGASRSEKRSIVKKLVALAELVSQGETEPEELKALADELLEDDLLVQIRLSLREN